MTISVSSSFSIQSAKLHRLISETSADAPADFGAATLVNTFNNIKPVHAPKSVVMNGTPYNYGYDANGNMANGWDFSDPTQAASRTIAYNGDNMPKTITHRKRQANDKGQIFDIDKIEMPCL